MSEKAEIERLKEALFAEKEKRAEERLELKIDQLRYQKDKPMFKTLWHKIEPRLIDGWECAYKLMTIWIAAAMVAVSTAYEYLPVIQQYLPDGWVRWMALAIIVARLIKQSRPQPKPKE